MAEEQLKGRTYYAQDVVGSLVDTLGSFKDAVNKSIELSNIKITTMEGLTNLQSIESCNNLQSVDGTVTLNEAQLTDIDSRIAQGETKIATLTQERDNLKKDVANKDARIKTLETALENGNDDDKPADTIHNGDPNKPTDEFKESTQEEAEEYARKVFNGEI